MFNANERIIGATYVMPQNLLDNIWKSIRLLQPSEENTSIEEVAISAFLDPDNYTENDKREQIIGAATVMSKDNACKIWDEILKYISIPEATPEELYQDIEENLKNNNPETK